MSEHLLHRRSDADSSDPHAETRAPLPRLDGSTRDVVPAIDRYEVLAKLGEGGMGAVYRARDRVLRREVALKVVRPDALTGEMRQRMLTEAQAVAALDHPGIVKVYDFGEWSPPGEVPAPYLSLEFVAGGSLSRHLASEPMAVGEAVRVVRLLAEAMAHAHARGVVHRDLKPDNVLMAEDGSPKVTDFGLAKKLDERSHTQTGAIMGTPAYMAPEQAGGQVAGPAADVYALGVVLYRLLAGKVPFDAPSVVDLLYKVCHEEPEPLRQVRPDVPVALEAVCLACMSKDATKRPSAAELASRLSGPSVPTTGQGTTVDLRPVRRRRKPWVLLPLLMTVVLGVMGWSRWGGKKQADPEPKKPAGVAKVEPLTAELVVRVWAPKRGVHGLKIGVDERAVPLREDEQVQAEVKLSEPAYAFLLLVDGKGHVQPFFPWNEDRIEVDSVAVPPPAKKTAKLLSPPNAEKGWDLDDTTGLDTFLLLARREPWPKERSLAELIGKVPSAPLRDPGEVVVRGWDGGQKVEALSLDRMRGVKKESAAIDDQLQQLVGRLQGEFEVVRAVQFAHVAKRK